MKTDKIFLILPRKIILEYVYQIDSKEGDQLYFASKAETNVSAAYLIDRSQCARMDLNKRFLPKPMTTTG